MNHFLKSLIVGMMALNLFSGCATEPIKMGTSEKVPAVEATVDATSTDNDNTRIKLEVRHLAEPQRVDPTATTYVVWARATKDSPAQSLGALSVDKNLRAELETVTPLKNFELFVTPESSPVVAAPAGEPLLWTNVSRQ